MSKQITQRLKELKVSELQTFNDVENLSTFQSIASRLKKKNIGEWKITKTGDKFIIYRVR